MFRVNRDPTLLPVKVRFYVAVTVIALFATALLFKCDAWHKMAGCGLILGIFGSGVLYWGTVAEDIELQSIVCEIQRVSSRKLSFSETNNVIGISYFSTLFFFTFLPPILLQFKSGQIDGFRAIRNVGIDLALFSFYPILFYLLIKALRISFGNWLQKFQESSELKLATKMELSPVAKIKRLLRKTGFASLFLSGVMQLPATLL